MPGAAVGKRNNEQLRGGIGLRELEHQGFRVAFGRPIARFAAFGNPAGLEVLIEAKALAISKLGAVELAITFAPAFLMVSVPSFFKAWASTATTALPSVRFIVFKPGPSHRISSANWSRRMLCSGLIHGPPLCDQPLPLVRSFEPQPVRFPDHMAHEVPPLRT